MIVEGHAAGVVVITKVMCLHAPWLLASHREPPAIRPNPRRRIMV